MRRRNVITCAQGGFSKLATLDNSLQLWPTRQQHKGSRRLTGKRCEEGGGSGSGRGRYKQETRERNYDRQTDGSYKGDVRQ